MISRKFLLLSLVGISGAAIACANLPFPVPPLAIKVSAIDVGKAMLAGFKAHNALNGALMMKLDAYGSTAVGEQVWKSNSFRGHLSFVGPTGGGAGIAYFEKNCDTTAEEQAKEKQATNSGGGDGGGYAGDVGGGVGGGGNGFSDCNIEEIGGQSCVGGVCYPSSVTVLDCPFG